MRILNLSNAAEQQPVLLMSHDPPPLGRQLPRADSPNGHTQLTNKNVRDQGLAVQEHDQDCQSAHWDASECQSLRTDTLGQFQAATASW